MAIKFANSLQEVIQAAFSTGNEVVKFAFGEVPIKFANHIRKEFGFSIDGYHCVVDTAGVRHAIDAHGNPKGEASRGQIAITVDDFSAVPKVVMQPDSLRYEGKNNQGNHTFLFQKVVSDNIFCVEEIRTGRKEIALKTMYKRKAPTNK